VPVLMVWCTEPSGACSPLAELRVRAPRCPLARIALRVVAAAVSDRALVDGF